MVSDKNSQIEVDVGRHTDRQTYRDRNRQTAKDRQRQTDRDRHTRTETDSDKQRRILCPCIEVDGETETQT